MGSLAVRCALVTGIALAAAGCAAEERAAATPTVQVGPERPPPVFPTPGERLCALLTEDNAQIERAAMSLASIGDPDARAAGGTKLAALAAAIGAPAWREAEQAKLVAEGMEQALAEARAEDRQTEALAAVLAAMSHVGGPAVEKQARALAADASAPWARRELAERVLDRVLGRIAPAPRVAPFGRVPMGAPPLGEGHANLAPLRAALRRCYQTALQRNPDVRGRVQLRMERVPGGRLLVTVDGDALPADLIRCIKDAATAWPAPPDAGGTTSLPLTFVFHPG
jgi:hypothetical protein